MFKIIVCLSVLVVISNAQRLPIARALGAGLIDDGSLGRPEPYSFGYEATDEFGTVWTRQEEGDGNGNVRGSYSYREANGIGRTVEYVADPVNGFSANVVTNEPGTLTSAPAAVNIRSTNN